MAGIVANISKGRTVELYTRVNNNDPANSALIMGVLVTGGDPLATLQDYETLADVLAGPSTEAAVAGYVRKSLTDAVLDPFTTDHTGNRNYLFLPLQTFSPNTGETWDIAWVAYDNDTTAGTDANIVPVSFHELRIDQTAIPTLTGSNIVVNFAGGWVVAV